jgi:uncharacterized membrane protein
MTKLIRFLPLAAVLLAACPSDDDGTEPTPAIAVSLGGAITVVQGQTGSTQVTVTRSGGHSAAVALTATGLPVGVTAAFNPATIPAGTGNGTSTLTLSAGPNAPTGSANFQVGANGGTNVTATATGSVTISAAPDFSLNVTPNAVAIDQGATGVANVAITRTGGFTGAVNLTVSGLPTGVTAAFDNAAPTGNTAVLTLTAAANAATGPATITVSGQGTPGTKTATFALTIQVPPGSFTLALDPGTVSIVQGANGQTTVNINKTGSFTGNVTLSVTGLPANVTAAFNPAQASPGQKTQDVQTSSVLTLTVGGAVAAQNYPLVVRGNADGQTEKTANLTLTVTASGGGGGFSLAVNPNIVQVEQGNSTTTNVSINKTGTFTGNVTLSVTGLPTGVTAAFNPPAASPGAEGTQDVQTTSVLTLTAAAGAEVKSSPLVIHGVAEGQDERTTNLSLTVQQAGTNGFTILVNPSTLTVEAGQNGQVTVNVNKTGTFNGPVALSVTNLPTGITAAFNPATGSAGKTTDTQTQSTLTLTVESTVAVQVYNLVIRGSAEGLPNSDFTLPVSVTAAPGGFTLAANPTTVNIQQGQSGGTTILVDKTGSFSGNVTLSVTGLPAGVTATFNPPTPSPRRPNGSASARVIVESIMSINVGAGVAVDDYPLVVRGTAPNQTDQTVNVTLNVTSSGGGSGNSSIKYCDLDNLPIWFAFKDGNGPWTQVNGVVAGDGTTYTFDITQSTGAFAVVTGSASDGYQTSVTYGTQAQLSGNNGQCPTAPFTRTLNGSVAGIDPTDQVIIAMGGSGANAAAAPGTFQLQNVLDAPSDLIAVRNSVSFGPPIAITPVGIIIRRALNIAHNGTIPVLDFGAGPAEAFAPATAQFTVTGAGADNLVASMSFVTTTTTASISNALLPTSPFTLHGIPTNKHNASDLHQLGVIASTNTGDARGHFQWFKDLVGKTVDLGAGLTAPTVTSLGNAPYPRYQSTGPIQAIYNDFFSFSMTQTDGTDADFRSWTIIAFGGVFTGANYTMAIEDLTSAGYQTAWALKVGVETNHQTQGVGFSNNGTANPMVEGGFSDFASRGGQVTP